VIEFVYRQLMYLALIQSVFSVGVATVSAGGQSGALASRPVVVAGAAPIGTR